MDWNLARGEADGLFLFGLFWARSVRVSLALQEYFINYLNSLSLPSSKTSWPWRSKHPVLNMHFLHSLLILYLSKQSSGWLSGVRVEPSSGMLRGGLGCTPLAQQGV